MTLLFEDKDLATPQYDDDSHPLFLYLHGTVQLRSDIILNHPDVTGFVYLHDDVITKAFLPKKIINFKSTSEDRNNIAAVSGDTDDYTPFWFPRKIYLVMPCISRTVLSSTRRLLRLRLPSFLRNVEKIS